MTFIQGKREVSPLPILWEDKASSFPLSLLLLICLPAVTCHNLPCCNFCLQYGQKLCMGWTGLTILQSCSKTNCLSQSLCTLNTKIPIRKCFQGSVCCSNSTQQNRLFYLAFLSLLGRNLFHCTWQHHCYSTGCSA